MNVVRVEAFLTRNKHFLKGSRIQIRGIEKCSAPVPSLPDIRTLHSTSLTSIVQHVGPSRCNQRCVERAVPFTKRLSRCNAKATISTNKTSTTSESRKQKRVVDPLAKKPNKNCDPYGNNGQPLSMEQINIYSPTIDPEWKIEVLDSPGDDKEIQAHYSLRRQFYHANYLDASKFTASLAAVCHLQNHFARLAMERLLHPKHRTWVVATEVVCFTPVLNGLSVNDFHLAMLIDVECQRQNMQQLQLKDVIE